jgi:hypothetical protein
VLAFAVHEVDSFTDVYADDTQITNAQITAVAGNSNDGKVTATKYANMMWVRRYAGTASQTVDFILTDRYPTVFPSTFRGRGIAYAAMTFDWGDGKLYRGPPLMTFIIKGKKCYDPRLDSSPGADPTNAAYAVLTENPALGWADYAMADYGGVTPSANIDWASVVAAADICDELVDIPGATTQKRYTFNARIALPVDPDWRQNAKLFIDGMLGRMVYRNGKWFIYAGAWEDASYTIEKEDWLEIGRIKTVAPRDGGRWNTVRCWYVDPVRNWQRVECYPRRNATYKSADGAEEIALEMEQPGCTSEYEAQRKAELLLRQSRNQIAMSGKLPPRFRKMATGEVVALNFAELGWVSKLMRIRTMSLNPDGTVDAGLVEEQETDWTDLAAGEYNAPSSATIPAVNPTSPSEPQSFNVENSINGTLAFAFDSPVVRPLGTRFQIIRSTNSSDASVGTVVWDGVELKTEIAAPNSLHWYWSRSYASSYYSGYSPSTYGLAAAGRYAVNDFRRIVPDPDIRLSSAIGSYWSGRTDVFSLDLAGGVNSTGRIHVSVRSFDSGVQQSRLVAMPQAPYPQWAGGYQVGVGFRVRRTAAMSWSTAVLAEYRPTVFITAWNGVGTPAPQEIGGGGNCRSFPGSTCYIDFPDISSLALNVWKDYQQNMILDWNGLTTSSQLFAHPTSYPYPVLCIQAGIADGRAGSFEFDFVGVFT